VNNTMMSSHFGEFVLLNIDLKIMQLFFLKLKIRFETVISIFQKGPDLLFFPLFLEKSN
jgi:hypothetical protein